jgi:NADH:ubiquinone oxidoreductase subunit E
MTTISVCVGSACHLHGAYDVLSAFSLLLEKYKVGGSVDLTGEFCQGRCIDGVVVKINDEIITRVSRKNVYAIFYDKVLKGEKL